MKRFAVALALAGALAARAAAAEGPAPARCESFREALRTFAADGRYLVTFPSRASAKGTWLAAGVVAATALTIRRDQAVRDNIVASDRPGAARIAARFEPLGRQQVEAAALGTLYLAGRVAGNSRVASTAATTFESYLWATVITSVSKVSFGRERPGGGSGEGRFFAGDSIFPSGHTLRSFAIASVLADRYGRRAALVAYPVAALVGLSMIQEDRHWASDVVAGAGLGMAIGKGIAARHPGPRSGSVQETTTNRAGASWTFVPRPGGAAARIRF